MRSFAERKENSENPQESYAYTPGLKVKAGMTVERTRRLPVKGEVLVKEGDRVTFDDVIARTILPGDPYIVKATDLLGVEPWEMSDFVVKKVGEEVKKEEPLAVYKMFFGLSTRYVRSPVDGVVEGVSNVTGQIVIRSDPVPLIMRAYLSGRISRVIASEGVVVQAEAALIQGIFGIGGETHGRIKMAVDSRDQILEADMLSAKDKDHILIGGSKVTYDLIQKATAAGTAGIVCGSIDRGDLDRILGKPIGVAITGEEKLGLTLIITEGFGDMPMSRRTYNLFKEFEGCEAAINGSTQIRAGVIRPEIIIPHQRKVDTKMSSTGEISGMVLGTPVRIIRQPYFGAIGEVSSLPVELRTIETGSKVRVVEVDLEDDRRVTVPRANVEIIEE